MRFELWPCRVEDLISVDVQRMQRAQVTPTILRGLQDQFLYLYARALKCEGKTFAVFGVNPARSHVGFGWALLSEQVLTYPVALTKAAWALIEKAQSILDLWRLEIAVDTKHESALRWAQLLGFEVEGMMRCFGPNREDAYLMARIWS